MKEKLSIEEIIAHCERVTKNYEKYGDKSLGDISNFHAKEYWEHYQVKGYLEELKKYLEIGTLEELNNYMNQSEEEFNMLAEYLGIGTIEECREAVEKRKPMKPVKTDTKGYRYTDTYRCPTCGGNFSGTGIADYCYHCGQRLDWSEVE